MITPQFKLRNASQSGSDIIVTKRTKIEDGNNNEVNYEYSPATEHDMEPSVVDIQNVSQAKSLPEGRFVRVRAHYFQTSDQIKQVNFRSRVTCLSEKNASIDESGWVSLTIWEQQFGLLVNGRTYEVGLLQVKEFGEKYFATTSKMPQSETASILDKELILAMEDQVIEAQG